MPFHVKTPNGCLQGEYDAVVISTDLESDDAVAIKCLAPRLRDVPLMVVVGEGDTEKQHMMKQMLMAYQIDGNAIIVQGRKSDTHYPSDILDCYSASVAARPASNCTILETGSDPATKATQMVKEFLSKYERPLAVLLKPPFEFLDVPEDLLKKASAVLYGSFNINTIRSALADANKKKDPKEFFEEPFNLMRKFKVLLWVERSASVGRDCVVDTVSAPDVWNNLEKDLGLLALVKLWNTETIRAMTQKIADFPAAMEKIFPPARPRKKSMFKKSKGVAGLKPEAVVAPKDEQYVAHVKLLEKLDKRVQVLLNISQSRAKQMPHADTLAIASLLDDDGGTVKFERKVSLAVDERNKPTFAEDPSSTVYALVTEPGPLREELISVSIERLVRGLADY